MSEKNRVVILGGGFGGVNAARALDRLLSRDSSVEVVLVSDENFLLFTPMLPEVAASGIEPRHIVSPLRAFFRNVQFHNSQIRQIDLAKRMIVIGHCPNCSEQRLEFDHLVVALGSVTNFYGLPDVARYALPMKTLSDAMVVRNRIIDRFEHANMEQDAGTRRALLTFVVAGGGFAGTETVGELHDFADTARAHYPNIRREDVRVVLVHHGSRIMPEISEDLADYALGQLQRKGVEVRLQTGVAQAGADWVQLTSGERISTRTLIWTAGVSPHPLVAGLPCRRGRRGRLVVNESLEVPGHQGVWALGDCAEVDNKFTGQLCPPTAQYASRQGAVIAANIVATLQGGHKNAFSYKPLGVLASLGRRMAVAEIRGLKFSGFFAWWLWRTIYLLKLPGLERKVRVAGDWTLDLFFPRDVVLLKMFTSHPSREVSVGTDSQATIMVEPTLH
jgi:NADH:ubiquinone reductase (H+-translocating)